MSNLALIQNNQESSAKANHIYRKQSNLYNLIAMLGMQNNTRINTENLNDQMLAELDAFFSHKVYTVTKGKINLRGYTLRTDIILDDEEKNKLKYLEVLTYHLTEYVLNDTVNDQRSIFERLYRYSQEISFLSVKTAQEVVDYFSSYESSYSEPCTFSLYDSLYNLIVMLGAENSIEVNNEILNQNMIKQIADSLLEKLSIISNGKYNFKAEFVIPRKKINRTDLLKLQILKKELAQSIQYSRLAIHSIFDGTSSFSRLFRLYEDVLSFIYGTPIDVAEYFGDPSVDPRLSATLTEYKKSVFVPGARLRLRGNQTIYKVIKRNNGLYNLYDEQNNEDFIERDVEYSAYLDICNLNSFEAIDIDEDKYNKSNLLTL